MPVNKKFDLVLSGSGFEYGYMISRATSMKGRAWQRTGQPDTPDKRARAAETVGVLPPQIDFPELWDDWSGGFGYPYREPRDTSSFYGFYENPNRYHWAENFDTRYPHQLVHTQQMQTLDGHPNVGSKVLNLMDVPAPSLGGPIVAGMGGVLISTAGAPTGITGRLYPTGLAGSVDSFDLLNLEPMAAGPGRPAIFGSYVYIAVANGSTNNRFLKTTLNDTAVGTQGDHNPLIQGWITAGNRLWGYQGDGRRVYVSSVAAGADPAAGANAGGTAAPSGTSFPSGAAASGFYPPGGNWTATLNISNGQAQINDMISFKDQVFVGLENGLYAGDLSGTFVNVLDDLAGQADRDNCRDLAIHNGQVVAQHVAGIYAYNPTITTIGQIREIGPNLFSNQSPVAGMVRALKAGGPWLYAGLWSGTQGYILAGIDDNPPGPYSWHVMQRLPHQVKPTRIHIDGIVAPSGGLAGQIPQRMWVATDPSGVGTSPLYVWPIPVMNGDPLGTLNDFHSKANFVGSARMDLGQVNNRAPTTPKLYRSVEVTSENLGSPYRYCDVYYSVDRGARTLLGRVLDSPRSTLYFPSDQGSAVTGYGIELSLESFGWTPLSRTPSRIDGGAPIVITITAHGFTTGDTVWITSDLAFVPGTWTITVLTANTFSLDTSQSFVLLPDPSHTTVISPNHPDIQNATSPVYRSIVLRSTFRPDSVDLISAVLDVADGTNDRQGAPMRPGDVQLAELRALSRQTSPVLLTDLAGAQNIVEVLAPVEEQEVYQAGDQNPTVAATIKMAVMTFTAS
jgi:hypothetical protein